MLALQDKPVADPKRPSRLQTETGENVSKGILEGQANNKCDHPGAGQQTRYRDMIEGAQGEETEAEKQQDADHLRQKAGNPSLFARVVVKRPDESVQNRVQGKDGEDQGEEGQFARFRN